MIVLFDWDGTIAKKEVANEASMRRFAELGADVDREWLSVAQKTHAHYDLNKALIERKYGITDEREKTIIMTDLFRKFYPQVVSEWKEGVFYDGMLRVIEDLAAGNELGILSTIRKDILESSLDVLGRRHLFRSIFANNSALEYSKMDLMRQFVDASGEPDYMIGDRIEDILAGKSVGAKTILVLWGNNTKDAECEADYVVRSSQELLNIIR